MMGPRKQLYGVSKVLVGASAIKRETNTKSYQLGTEGHLQGPGQIPPQKSYKDIPGPKPLPLIGNVFRFVPYLGEYGNAPMLTQLEKMRDTYGDIVRLDGILNRRSTVFLFTPELCEKMYRTEGMWPTRIAMESMHHYRRNRVSIYGGEYGLVTSQGKQWHDFRSKVNQHLMQPRSVRPHVKQINEVSDELIAKMRDLRDADTKQLPAVFNNELNKWALEAMCSIALNSRLGCLKPNLTHDSEPQKMINCVHEMFDLMFKLEIMPSLWKVYNTPTLKRMFHVLDTFNEIAIKYVDEAKAKLQSKVSVDKHDRSVLEKLLEEDGLTAQIMAVDMLTAGVDTTGNSAAALLYYLANNPDKQEKLREEAMRVMPTKLSPLTVDSIGHTSYVKACIKESLRLFPISIGTLRTMPADIDLDGYRIEKGVDVIACHGVLSLDPAYFPEVTRFIPERWLRNETEFPPAKEAHPFTYMPFGFGARTCVGRRFAELEMETLVLKVVRNFKLEWHHKPLKYNSGFINTVATPMQLTVIDL